MEWREDGTVLKLRRHGEHAAIIELFTQSHGRHAGVVRGGAGRKLAPTLQPGNRVDVTWRARLHDHLGSYAVEPLRSRSAVMSGRLALAGLNAVTALICFCLPEREPYPVLYRRTEALLDLLGQDDLWPLAYLQWEMALLDETGFGLDLSVCAVSGTTRNLCYISPKSGRAVARSAAGKWAHQLLPLPPVLRKEGEAGDAEILQALSVTGYFLSNKLAPEVSNKPLPDARQRLIERLRRGVGAT